MVSDRTVIAADGLHAFRRFQRKKLKRHLFVKCIRYCGLCVAVLRSSHVSLLLCYYIFAVFFSFPENGIQNKVSAASDVDSLHHRRETNRSRRH